MAEVEVISNPTGLVRQIDGVTDEENGRMMFVIDWDGTDPEYKLEKRPLGATMHVRDGVTRRKAVVKFSGLPFPPRDLPKRCLFVKDRPGSEKHREATSKASKPGKAANRRRD